MCVSNPMPQNWLFRDALASHVNWYLAKFDKFVLFTYPFIQKCSSSPKPWISSNFNRCLCRLLTVPGLVEFCRCAGPCHNAKFAKLWSMKGGVLVSDAKSNASDFHTVHSHAHSCVSSTYGFWSIVYWTNRLKFIHQKWDRKWRCPNRTLIFIKQFYYLHVLLNATPDHNDLENLNK